jgi:hypothetical protein
MDEARKRYQDMGTWGKVMYQQADSLFLDALEARAYYLI